MPYVPVIDLSRDPAVVGAELDEVCTNVGFFQVTGHGVPEAMVIACSDSRVDPQKIARGGGCVGAR